MKYLIIIILLLSCTPGGKITASGNVSPVKYYKRDMKITINGISGRGMIIAPRSNRYEIVLEFDDRVELVKLRTCHRELTVEKDNFWEKKKHKFILDPVPAMEIEGYCPISLVALDLDGANTWGFIEIQNEKLKATVICNGSVVDRIGVSVCQSMAGLLESIQFKEPVNVSAAEGCPLPKPSSDRRIWTYPIGLGDCMYLFGSKGNYHRLSTYGYRDIYLRKIEG